MKARFNGDSMKMLREACGLSVIELASMINKDRSSVYRYENGTKQPNFETACQMCAMYDVDLGFLLGQTSERKGVE
jgi:predicted transcriptional regulator